MKQKNLTITIVAILLLFLYFPVVAQNAKQIPEIINSFDEPTLSSSSPLFYKLIKKGETDISKIDKAFEKFEEKKSQEKITEAKNMEEEFEDTNPYSKFYKRWRRGIENYILPNGMIRTFSEEEMRTFYTQSTQKIKVSSSDKRQSKSQTNTWSLVGPVNTYKVNIYGNSQPATPWQVNVYSIAVAPSNPSVLYCGTETGGLFKTIDKGLNWVSVNSNYNFIGSTSAIAVHPTDPNIVYACISRNIMKSTDGGLNWSSAYYSSASALNASKIIINPTTPSTVFVSTESGLLRSTDDGVNWTSLYSGQRTYDAEFKPDNPNTIYAVRDNGSIVEFVKSTDGGNTFNVSNTGWPTGVANGSGALLAVSPANSNIVYAVWLTNTADSNGNKPRFIKSIDGGNSWTVMPMASLGTDKTNWQGFYDFTLAASPTNANKVIFGMFDPHISTDGGTTFTEILPAQGNLFLHPDQQCIVVTGNDTWMATDGGINYSTDFFNTNSQVRVNGIYASEFWGFNQGWNEDIMVGGRYHNGNTAISGKYPYNKALNLGGGEDATGWMYPGQPGRASFSDLGTHIMPDNFNDIMENSNPNIKMYPTMDALGYDYSEVLIHPNYFKTIYLGQGNTLWKSDDNGFTFSSVYTFPLKVRRFALSRSNPKCIYLATDKLLYKSTDEGVTFTQILSGLGNGNWLLAINAFDEQQVWFVNRSGTNGNKVFKTTDGGTSSINMTTTTLDNLNIKALAYDGRDVGSIYIGASPSSSASTNGSNSYGGTRVFYYNTNTSAWDDYSSGLPGNFSILRMIPFYRDGKLRAAGNMGIWEMNLINPSIPQALPIASTNTVYCSRDIVQFEDYSILNHSGATWNWSFNPAPASINNANIRNPKVTFSTPGSYDVTLTVTSAAGSSTKTIPAMITVSTANGCNSYDTIAGSALNPKGTGGYAVANTALGITTNNFTISAWVRPTGTQTANSKIIDCNGNTSLLIKGTTNELGYVWGGVNSSISSGLIVPPDQWSHVALVIEPTQVTFYLNGQKATKSATNNTTIFGSPITMGSGGVGGGINTMNGAIDEICLWNRVLPTDEIRQLRHLTKSPTNTSGLIAYYQFNESGITVYDKTGGRDAEIMYSPRIISTAPVGGGVSSKQNVTTAGTYNYTTPGVDITFGTNTPNGDVWVSRIDQSPDQKPTSTDDGSHYWIVNNYGSSNSFDPLTSIKFYNTGLVDSSNESTPAKFSLFKRTDNAEGITWGSSISTGSSASIADNNSVTFPGNTISSFSQFSLSNNNTLGIEPLNYSKANAIVYPNPVQTKGTIDISIPQDGKVEIDIISTTGQQLQRITNKRLSAGKTTIDFNTNNLASGLYFLKMKVDGKDMFMTKLIKQ